MRIRLFFLIFVVGATLLILQDLGKWHLIANFLGIDTPNLYRAFWWFDDVMHVIGGLGAGLGCAFLYSLKDCTVFYPEEGIRLATVTIIGATLIGIFFELAQHGGVIPFHEAETLFDTATDILCDIFGGVLAFWMTCALADKHEKRSHK